MLKSGKTATPFHFWISFWPVAPMFGVEWRFQKLIPGSSYFRPADIAAQMAAASVAEAVKATAEATASVARAAEAPVEAPVEAKAEPVVEVAPAPSVEAAEACVEAMAPAAEDAVPVTMDSAEAEAPAALRPAFLFEGRPEDADDLKRIKGVGPKLEEMLNGMGIYRFAQIAEFEPGHLAWVDENLTAFKGRPFRDDWIAQAKSLL